MSFKNIFKKKYNNNFSNFLLSFDVFAPSADRQLSKIRGEVATILLPGSHYPFHSTSMQLTNTMHANHRYMLNMLDLLVTLSFRSNRTVMTVCVLTSFWKNYNTTQNDFESCRSSHRLWLRGSWVTSFVVYL